MTSTVGSPKVFREYIKSLERKKNSKVISYSFRNKRVKRNHINEYVTRIEFDNGYIQENINDLYCDGFLQALFLRPSCGDCKYANIDRTGDLTIGDLKKRYENLPNYKEIENLSVIIVNTQKGLEVYKKLSTIMDIYYIDFDKLVETNTPLQTPSKMSKHRESFFEEFKANRDVYESIRKYVDKPSLGIKLWSLLPIKTRNKVRRRFKWIKKSR